MPLARRIARGYHTPLQREDVEQVAYLALVKAAGRFDPARGSCFRTYAIPTIQGEIKHYLRDHSWDLHVPRLLQDRALRAQRVRDELTAELGRGPRIEELAERLGVSVESALEAVEAAAARDAHSLDAPPEHPRGQRPASSLAETSRGEGDDLARALDRAALRSALAVLSDEERRAIGLRFLGDLTQSEIANRIGISQMQVSRVLRRALDRMYDVDGRARAQPWDGRLISTDSVKRNAHPPHSGER
jgi:RNA polymerase sigma-B factor